MATLGWGQSFTITPASTNCWTTTSARQFVAISDIDSKDAYASYFVTPSTFPAFVISWNNSASRWEITAGTSGNLPNRSVVYYTSSSTSDPKPPALDGGTWTEASTQCQDSGGDILGSELGATDIVGEPFESVAPVELSFFQGQATQEGILLEWSTANELNNAYFQIERQLFSGAFEVLTTIDGQGTTNYATNYQYLDTDPLQGQVIYRLKQVDFDGTFDYSDFLAFSVEGINALFVYPTTTTDVLNIVQKDVEQSALFQIFDYSGRLVFQTQLEASEFQTLNVSQLEGGVYFYRIPSLDSAVGRFVKQ